MTSDERKTLEALHDAPMTSIPAMDAIRAALAEVDALTQQVRDLEARAIPKELLDTRRFEIELCWHPLVAGVVARYAKPMANGDWQVEWVSSPADAERVELFPTLSAALSAAREAP